MKKKLALILALVLVLALFAGCGGTNAGNTGNNAANSTPESSNAANSTDEVEATPTEEPSPYNYAAGKYEVNQAGYPTEKYVYELPLSTTGESFTKWTTCYTPQFIPEDGWGAIETWAGVREMTGVTIEYDVVPSDTRKQNFSVLLASDALEDIMDQATYFYSGTPLQAISEGYFVNLIDYTDYMPCYLYEAYTRSLNSRDVMDRVYYDDQTMVSMTGMIVEPAPGMGLVVRQDWMDDLGLGKAADITTYDELTDLLTAYKTLDSNCFPMWIHDTIEIATTTFSGFNTMMYAKTMTYIRVVDNKVEFCGTTNDDRDAMTLLNSWYSKGFIDPNYTTHTSSFDSTPLTSNGLVGVMPVPPASIGTMETTNIDPDCRWEAIPVTKKTDDQILQYGHKPGNFHYGSASISTTCDNIPLAVTWLDWWMSEQGSEWTSWGPEGLMWEYNEAGQRQLTDFILNHEAGMAWAMCLYGCNGLVEFCLQIHKRNYAYPGGERFLQVFDTWTVTDYEGAYDWPSGVKLNDEQSAEANNIMTDVNTFFAENYITFIDGSRSLTEWDSFQKELSDFGLKRVIEIYQEAYDAYNA
jgi:putative aldouronate transport system substrate-binding protein